MNCDCKDKPIVLAMDYELRRPYTGDKICIIRYRCLRCKKIIVRVRKFDTDNELITFGNTVRKSGIRFRL